MNKNLKYVVFLSELIVFVLLNLFLPPNNLLLGALIFSAVSFLNVKLLVGSKIKRLLVSSLLTSVIFVISQIIYTIINYHTGSDFEGLGFFLIFLLPVFFVLGIVGSALGLFINFKKNNQNQVGN